MMMEYIMNTNRGGPILKRPGNGNWNVLFY